MIATLGDAPSESTLLRHFRSLDIPTGTPAAATGRFEAAAANEIWVGDGLHGPRIAGQKTYLFAFLDDHSRLVVAARWAFAEDTVRLAAALRPAMEARGIPQAVYVDNGSAFCDASLVRICAQLGIRLIHSRPYRPQGRGKIERFFNTVTSQFLSEITTTEPSTTSAAAPTAGTVVSTLAELNALFTSWVEVVYHRTTHTTTGQTPLERWDANWADRRPRRKDPEVIAEAFRWSAHRTVTKTGTVSLHANTYQVDPLLAGARVELIYDPFDLTAPLAVTAAGVPAGQAVLLEISRHVHPKAAAASTDTGATQTTSGIDYLRLIQTRHKDTMSAQPITFTAITDTADPDTADPDTAGKAAEQEVAR
jgi:putative transposase